MNWLQAILLFLPAGLANATPVIANKIPVIKNWQTPLDFGISWRGKRLLGTNKTWRGVLTGSLIGGLTALLLSPIVDYHDSLWATFGLGFIMGFGALFGDAVESAIKRRRGIPAGSSWFPFDQTDYIIGGLLFIYPWLQLSVRTMAVIIISYFGLHLVVVYVAHSLGIRDKPI